MVSIAGLIFLDVSSGCFVVQLYAMSLENLWSLLDCSEYDSTNKYFKSLSHYSPVSGDPIVCYSLFPTQTSSAVRCL